MVLKPSSLPKAHAAKTKIANDYYPDLRFAASRRCLMLQYIDPGAAFVLVLGLAILWLGAKYLAGPRHPDKSLDED